MSARDEILARLRKIEREMQLPPAWRSRRHFDDLVARFTTALTAVRGEVVTVESLEAALTHLRDLLAKLQAERVVVNPDAPLNNLDLPTMWPDLILHVVGQTSGDLRLFCARADVGLSGARAALAETGSLVVTSGPAQSRLATLLPPVHIALVSHSALTTDIFTWMADQKTWPANVTLISGPSKTADIEQTLAVGVHGPKRLVVILYG